MGANTNSSICWAASAVLAIAMTITIAPAAQAKPNHKEAAGRPANLVGQVDLSGGPINRMLLVKKKHKEYLVAELGSSSSVALLDVTDPRRPRTVETTAGSAGASTAGASTDELRIVADTLSLFGTTPTEMEATPKEIRHVPGVTTFIVDRDHGLIYTAIGNQLWIVKTKLRAQLDDAPDAATLYYGGGD